MKKEYLDAIEAMFNDEFMRGYDNGVFHGTNTNNTRDYERGLHDAWKCARKIFVPVNKGGLSGDEVIQIFNSTAPYKIFDNYSASEAIAKIKEYEKKQDDNEIKAGDEVISSISGFRYIVLRIDEDGYATCIDGRGKISVQQKGCFKAEKHNQSLTEALKRLQEEG